MAETLHIDYSVGEKVEELGSSHTIGGNVKYNDHLEKRVQQFQDKSNIYISTTGQAHFFDQSFVHLMMLEIAIKLSSLLGRKENRH